MSQKSVQLVTVGEIPVGHKFVYQNKGGRWVQEAILKTPHNGETNALQPSHGTKSHILIDESLPAFDLGELPSMFNK